MMVPALALSCIANGCLLPEVGSTDLLAAPASTTVDPFGSTERMSATAPTGPTANSGPLANAASRDAADGGTALSAPRDQSEPMSNACRAFRFSQAHPLERVRTRTAKV
jgi:hypothetical protein